MQINGVTLKNYQAEALEKFSAFLAACNAESLRDAYPDYAGENYNDPEWSDPSWKKTVPDITLRAPTGAGKTILTSAFIGAVASEFNSDLSPARLAVIAVPSKELIRQTARQYNDPKGYPRRILEGLVGKNIRVILRDDALHLKPADLENNFTILITTFAGFRREEKGNLRVYRENGALLPFFENLSAEEKSALLTSKDLSTWKEGDFSASAEDEKPIPSLVNLLRLERPIVAIDESHQSGSPLSFDMIDSFAPRFVLETTATPRSGSNVLISISPVAVKAEKMLRLPINLLPSDGWQDCLVDAKSKRNDLEKSAKKLKSPLRPIVLIQAEQADHENSAIDKGRVSVYDALAFLENQLKIPREEIAIRTGKKDDLGSIDLLDAECPIRYIITVQAAAEGWDCPYAYILAALAVGNSKIGVEQVMGRILRQYKGIEQKSQDLNEAYVYAGTQSFEKTATEVIGSLENHGYSKDDVKVQGSKEVAGGLTEADAAFIREEFKDVEKPLLGIKQKSRTAVLENRVQLLEEAEKQKKKIPLGAVSHNLQQPKLSGTSLVLDIDESTGKRTEEEVEVSRTDISSQYDEFTLEQIKDSLKRQIRLDGVQHEDIKKIIDATIQDNFSDWSTSQMHMRLPDIKQAITTGVKERVADLAEEVIKDSISKGSIVADSRPFDEKIYQKTSSNTSAGVKKHLYTTVAPMNKEEEAIAQIFENSSKIKCWLRVPERTKGSYYLPGFHGDHYPDFLAIGVDGKVYICEYKGEQLAGNKDTKRKERIGNLFTKVYGANKAEYFMVTKAAKKDSSEEITPDKLAEILS